MARFFTFVLVSLLWTMPVQAQMIPGGFFEDAVPDGLGDGVALTTSMVSWYSLNEGDGQNRLDSHGNGGTLVDAGTMPSTTGKVGNASDHAGGWLPELAATPDPDYTIDDNDAAFCAWVWLDDKSVNRTIMSRYDTATDQRQYFLQYNQANDAFNFQTANTSEVLTSVFATSFGSPAINTWYYVCAKHDAVNDQIGIAVLPQSEAGSVTWDVVSFSGGVNPSPSPDKWGLGFRQENQILWDGRIDEAVFWKGRIPLDGEILCLQNDGVGRDYATATGGVCD